MRMQRQIPSRNPSVQPKETTTEMVEAMAPGSVVVDLAAERGGNCEVTSPGETIDHNGVAVLGPCNMPSDIPVHASEMFSRNAVTFLQLMIKGGKLNIDTKDEIIRETLLTQGNVIVNGRVRELLGMEPLEPTVSSEDGGDSASTEKSNDERVVSGDSAAP